jgi:hypothetical protein
MRGGSSPAISIGGIFVKFILGNNYYCAYRSSQVLLLPPENIISFTKFLSATHTSLKVAFD